MEPYDEYAPVDEVPQAIPAATLVIFRRGPTGGPAQLLMLERSSELAFAGGATVFPGGRIDHADRELARDMLLEPSAQRALDEDELASRIAAVRETLEETGLAVGFREFITADEARAARDLLMQEGALAPVLERVGWTLAPEHLIPFARWCPKHHHRRVFDTRFYLVDLGTGAVELAVDATENSHLFWASAAEALKLADEGKIRVIFPTRRNLERLAQFDDFAACRAHAESIPVRTISPFNEERDGASWLRIPDDRGYPVTEERLEHVERG